MEELSIFVDESGDAGETSTYYLITIVLHDQARDICQILEPYEADLRARRVADIPMHLGPLLNGNDDYKGLGVSTRKALLNSFRVMADKLPFQYMTFAYRKSEYADYRSLFTSMKRDLVLTIFDNLDFSRSSRRSRSITTTVNPSSPTPFMMRLSTHWRGMPLFTATQSRPTTAFSSLRITSVRLSSRRSNTRRMPRPRRTECSSASGARSRRTTSRSCAGIGLDSGRRH